MDDKKSNLNINEITFTQKLKSYRKDKLSFLLYLLVLLSAIITISILVFLLSYILYKGIPSLSLSLFEWEYNSNNVSMMPAIINTFTMVLLSLGISTPIGIFSAIYLVEYSKTNSKFVKLIRLMTETLSGIPSIVYGLFGYVTFNIALEFGYSLISGALTLSIMVLPILIRTTEEALKSVPSLYKEGSFALGAGKLRTVFKIILPSAAPGILAGIILSIGRIVGETAALIYTSGTVPGIPSGIFSSGRTLAIHMYSLLSEGLHTNEAYATSVVILILIVLINIIANKLTKKFL